MCLYVSQMKGTTTPTIHITIAAMICPLRDLRFTEEMVAPFAVTMCWLLFLVLPYLMGQLRTEPTYLHLISIIIGSIPFLYEGLEFAYYETPDEVFFFPLDHLSFLSELTLA